jgi:hypothetical protein
VITVVGVQVALVELEHADVLHLRVLAQVVLRHAGLDAPPETLALREVQRIAEDDAGERRLVADRDLDVELALRAALDAADRRLDLLGAHPLVVALEERADRVCDRPAPGRALGGLGDRPSGADQGKERRDEPTEPQEPAARAGERGHRRASQRARIRSSAARTSARLMRRRAPGASDSGSGAAASAPSGGDAAPAASRASTRPGTPGR